MKIESASFSRKGSKPKNEDSILAPFEANGVWWAAVADGMGGHAGGDVASATVIDTIRTAIGTQPDADIAVLIRAAQQSLERTARRRPDLMTMGTTLSLVCISGRTARVGHVGDSRIYHLRADQIVDRTVDQTEVAQLVRRGVLSRAEAETYPRRNILLSALCVGMDYELHQEAFDLRDGDRVVLLTDGAWSMISRPEIAALSVREPGPLRFCGALLDVLAERSPQDDYTVVCLDIGA